MLAERLREPAERAVVADVLQKILNVQVCHVAVKASSFSKIGLLVLAMAAFGRLASCFVQSCSV